MKRIYKGEKMIDTIIQCALVIFAVITFVYFGIIVGRDYGSMSNLVVSLIESKKNENKR
jgi:hypothetical protein